MALKKGQRVKLVYADAFDHAEGLAVGDRGTVVKLDSFMSDVYWDKLGKSTAVYTGQIVPVEEDERIVTLDSYQEQALRTANRDGHIYQRFCNWSMGLAGETGELIDLLKKHIFHRHRLDRQAAKKELGDILWYVALLAHELGYTLSDVAETNIQKLTARYGNGFSSEASINRAE